MTRKRKIEITIWEEGGGIVDTVVTFPSDARAFDVLTTLKGQADALGKVINEKLRIDRITDPDQRMVKVLTYKISDISGQISGLKHFITEQPSQSNETDKKEDHLQG